VTSYFYPAGSIEILEGSGRGTFATPGTVVRTSSGPTGGPRVADLDGDGVPDLAFTTFAGVEVHLGRGGGRFGPGVGSATGPGPAETVVGNFNGDGVPDLAIANAGVAPI
jgi:hypothetical protein